ncbi:MAG: autotransporter outer membrane beta-barrel domain-containing protein [Akkermansia sp.]|nr:autotransporter outer membrane beta-barrel domain-containing protein [Akkermansia sp.]
MKKTLFLAMAFGLAGLSQATMVSSTGVVVNSAADLPVSGALSIGTVDGEGGVTVSSGVNLTLPGALFVGGKGSYSGAPEGTGSNGTLTLNEGATLKVGASDTSGEARSSHINVGNSKDAITGVLNINGATVSAEQVVVGQENGGTGHIVISGDGKLTLLHTQGELDAFHGLLIRKGDVTVKSTATLTNLVSETLVGTEDDAQLIIEDDAEAKFFAVTVGAEDGSTNSSVTVSGGSMTVEADLVVSESCSVTVTGADSSLSADAIWVDNSEVKVMQGASTEVAYVELTGDTATVTVDNATVDVSEAVYMNANTTMNVSNAANIGAAGTEIPYMELAAGANINVSGTSHIAADEIHFTVTNDNYSAGQIHLEDKTSTCTTTDVTVTVDGSLLDALTSGQEEIVLVSTQQDDAHRTIPDKVTWIVDERDITYTVDNDQKGLVLNLYAQNPDNPDQKPGDLVNDIIDSLVSPTSTATINTLNGTISALGGLFNVVKSQLQMPHNIEQPVGNVADDSRLAYTGRYYVGANRAWVSGLGASDRVATDGHGLGYHYVGGGYAVGYDRVITPQMYVGAALGQMIGKYKANNDLIKDNQTTYEASLYAHYTHEMKKSDNRFNVDAYIGGGRARNRAHGVLSAGSVARADGRWDDTTFGCGVRLSYDIVLSDAHIVTPFVGIEGIHAWQDKYTISNGTSTVSYHDGKASLWTVPVGVTYRYIAAIDKTEYLVPHVTVAYLGDISRKEPRVKYDWATGGGEVRGARPACSGFELETGLTWILNSEWSTGAFYTIDQRVGDCYQQVKAFVSYSF